MLGAGGANTLVMAQPGGTAVGLTVTPSTGAAGAQVVVAVISGAWPGVQVGFCQGVVAAGPLAAGNCGLGTTVTGAIFDDGTLDAPLVEWTTVYGPGVEPPAPAEPGSDFARGTVAFAPGATEATIEISVLGDAIDEPDEWIVAAFANPTSAEMDGF